MSGAVFPDHPPGEGEVHAMGPNTIAIKATSEDTGGGFFLSESTIAPGFHGPPPHVHERLHDMFYVLDGTLTMRLGDEEREGGPGTFVCVPPGTVHTFSNAVDATVRTLNLMAPGGLEQYLKEVAEATRGGPADPQLMAGIASKYDFHPAVQAY